MAVYSIKELENLSGIKAHTIRIWEKRYDLIEPHRTTSNIRYYTDQELKKVLNVAVLNRNGIKISNIAKLSELELKEEILRISVAHPTLENTIDALTSGMIDLDEIKINSILNKAIAKHGFTYTIKNIAYPFLKKVGILWQTGNVNPAQEHFVAYLIRQKIIAAIESYSNGFNPRAKKFLLFLPEGQWHEIGLLFAYYMLKEAGHEVIYLGQSVPYADVLATGAVKDFDHILISKTIGYKEGEFLTYIQDLSGAFPGKDILYVSQFRNSENIDLGDQYHHLQKIEDLEKYIKEIA